MPISQTVIRLEIIRDSDGLDAPRLNLSVGMKLGDNIELPRPDDKYLEEVIEPMADSLIVEYFKRRKQYCKLKPGVRGKCSLTEARRRVQRDLKRLRNT